MREDLIERLRREADISARPGQMDRLNALADEFDAALEAAREDAERYRWLRVNEQDRSDVFLACSFDDLDAAIDQARGKGGGEVG